MELADIPEVTDHYEQRTEIQSLREVCASLAEQISSLQQDRLFAYDEYKSAELELATLADNAKQTQLELKRLHDNDIPKVALLEADIASREKELCEKQNQFAAIEKEARAKRLNGAVEFGFELFAVPAPWCVELDHGVRNGGQGRVKVVVVEGDHLALLGTGQRDSAC